MSPQITKILDIYLNHNIKGHYLEGTCVKLVCPLWHKKMLNSQKDILILFITILIKIFNHYSTYAHR